MKRAAAYVAILAFMSACGGNSSTSPTPTPTVTSTTFTLSGQVSSTSPGVLINGATVSIADGPNAGKTTRTDASGSFSLTSLVQSGFTLNVSANGYAPTAQGVTLTSSQTRNVQLAPLPLFSASGSGNSVFDMPTYVSRIRITGDYGGFCQNFIVHIGGRGVVNEILGTCSVATTGRHYDAIALTIGGIVEILDASGVVWTFNEVAGIR